MDIINSSVIKLNELSSFALDPYLKKFKRTFIIYSIIIAISFALMILFKAYIEAVITIVLGITIIIMNIVIRNKTLKKVQENNSELSKGIYFEYVFKDTMFQVSAVAESVSDIREVNYESLYMIRAFADMLFLYINPNDAYVVKKSGFKNDDDWKNVIERLSKYRPCQELK